MQKAFTLANIRLTGQPVVRVALLACLAKVFGIQFHILGVPYGAVRSAPISNPYFGSFASKSGVHIQSGRSQDSSAPANLGLLKDDAV